MMEQAYGTTEDQIREVKSIARRFLGKTQNYQGFSQSFKTSVEEQVNKKVLGLLQHLQRRKEYAGQRTLRKRGCRSGGLSYHGQNTTL